MPPPCIWIVRLFFFHLSFWQSHCDVRIAVQSSYISFSSNASQLEWLCAERLHAHNAATTQKHAIIKVMIAAYIFVSPRNRQRASGDTANELESWKWRRLYWVAQVQLIIFIFIYPRLSARMPLSLRMPPSTTIARFVTRSLVASAVTPTRSCGSHRFT